MMQSKQRRKVAKAVGGWQMSCTAQMRETGFGKRWLVWLLTEGLVFFLFLVPCLSTRHTISPPTSRTQTFPDFSLTMSACELPSMTVMDLPPPSRPLKLKLKVASPDSVAIELHVRTCSLRHSLADCGFPVGGGYLDADDNLVEKGPGANYVRWIEALPFQHVSKIADIIENNANTGLINPPPEGRGVPSDWFS